MFDPASDGDGNNTALGYMAGAATTTGVFNTYVGSKAGDGVLTGTANTAVGFDALTSGNGDEDHNTCIGYKAGDVIDEGNSNTCIGSASDTGAATATNQTAIGFECTSVNVDNTITLGSADVTAVYMASDSDAVVHCGGINMSQNQPAADAGSMASEHLDHYEEGTWTPVLSDGSNNATMHGDAAGVYTRIGNVVRIGCLLQTTSLGSVSGAVRMTGLPFTTRNDNDSYAGLFVSGAGSLDITASESLSVMIAVNTTYATVKIWNATGGITGLDAAEWTSNGEAYIAGTYIV